MNALVPLPVARAPLAAAVAQGLASAPRRTLPAPRQRIEARGFEETGRLRWRAGSPPLPQRTRRR